MDSLLSSTAVLLGVVGPDLEDPRVVLGSVLLFVDERDPVVVCVLLDVRELLVD